MVKTSRQTESTVRSKTAPLSTTLTTIAHKKIARSTITVSTTGAPKNHSTNNTQSSSLASDMSADECDKTPTKADSGPRSSIVHNFALKTSPNEYKCNICNKVGYETIH